MGISEPNWTGWGERENGGSTYLRLAEAGVDIDEGALAVALELVLEEPGDDAKHCRGLVQVEPGISCWCMRSHLGAITQHSVYPVQAVHPVQPCKPREVRTTITDGFIGAL